MWAVMLGVGGFLALWLWLLSKAWERPEAVAPGPASARGLDGEMAPVPPDAQDGQVGRVGQTIHGRFVTGTVRNGAWTDLRVSDAPYDPAVHGPLR